ncbi:MAG: hypothetical protein H5T86_04140, partial [Armatimonadetes bacterium]|nr:hypothetical protein [Armatimonadota bacterium]
MLLWGTLVALGLCAAAASGAPKLQAWTVSCTQKVYPTTLLASQPGSAELYLARGEYEAIQVAVRSDQDVADCRVSIQPQGGASGTISSDWFDVFEASYVPTPADKEHKLTPDPLVPLKKRAGAYHVSLKADETKAIWIRFHAPESGPSGRFRVRVSLEARHRKVDLRPELG